MRLRVLSTARNLIKQYGFKGLCRAIWNKLQGRDLLAGFPGREQTYGFFGNAMKEWRSQREFVSELNMEKKIETFAYKPLISVVMPIYNAPPKWLAVAIDSVIAQSYTNWEIVAVDDGSKDRRCVSLLEEYSRKDDRVRLVCAKKNGGISAASNIGLREARGSFIALMDQDDAISNDAFFWMVEAINRSPDVDWLYSDECKVQPNEKVEPCDFILKPNWSPEFLYNFMYTGHLSVYRKKLVEDVGGFRSEYDFSQDYDLALRLAEATDKIVHVERILYYWRMIPTSGAAGGKDYARSSNLAALGDSFKRKNIAGNLGMYLRANCFHPLRVTNPVVSIIIPSDSTEMLKKCIEKLLGSETSYKNIEVVVVTNTKTGEEIRKLFSYAENIRICRYDKVYNFSDKCNVGVGEATGEYVIIYNDDVYPFSQSWIENLLEVMQYPGVGGASPITLYEDDTVQYAGMITGVPCMIGTAFNGMPFGYSESPAFNHFLIRDVSVLCGACMIMRRDFYLKIGGFDAVHTPTGHSDVDISFKIREQGFRCVFTPYAGLYHIGNHSWSNKKIVDKSDIFLLKRWPQYISEDPYFTQTIRKVFYRDVVHNFKINIPKAMRGGKEGKDILILSHELTRTGAPIVLKNVVRYFLDNGDWPVLASPVDGPLKEEFLEMGVPVIIDEGIVNGHWSFEHFARNFDLVFANTLAVGNAVSQLSNSLPHVIWWIHESEFAFSVFSNQIPEKLGKNVSVYSVSEYVERLLRKKNITTDGILQYGADDFLIGMSHEESGKKRFLVIGSVESRKGQDVAIKAFRKIPVEMRNKSTLVFIGQILDKNIETIVENAISEGCDIEVLAPMKHEKIMQLIFDSTAVLVPSRDDPLPVTATEALILGKPCIVSTHTGTASYIEDGINGLLFENENYDELMQKMVLVLNDAELSKKIGQNGRKLYEKEFSNEVFVDNFTRALDRTMKEHT